MGSSQGRHVAEPAHSEPVTTTHAEHGAGRPRLVVVAAPEGAPPVPKEHLLDRDVVTIGSGPDQDVQLPGLEPHHLSVVHDERDEYRVDAFAEVGGGSSAEPPDRALRTGATIRVRGWELSFYREEYADHGRPYGGREGGEGEVNRLQPPRPADQDDERVEEPAPGEAQVEDQQPLPERQQ
jgi:hypothetical protein